VILGYCGLLLIVSAVLAYLTRKLPSWFNESSYIALSIYTILLLSIIILILALTLDDFPTTVRFFPPPVVSRTSVPRPSDPRVFRGQRGAGVRSNGLQAHESFPFLLFLLSRDLFSSCNRTFSSPQGTIFFFFLSDCF
jgi:hypothetical protein